MPDNDKPTALAVCDGCGMERPDVADEPTDGYRYCDDCYAVRSDNPVVRVQGRAMLVSEVEAQAEEDEHMAAALGGDSIQEAIKAAKRPAHEH